jgi:hypothetical protein
MATAGSNGFDPTIVQRFVKEIEKHKETLLSYQGSYMKQCRDVRDMIKKAKELAKGEGIPTKQLNALLKERDLQRKLEGIREDFEDQEDLDTYDQLKEALGDFGELPLGAAALDAKKQDDDAEVSAANDDDETDVRPRHLREKEAERVARENGEKIKKGIKPLGEKVVVIGLPGADAAEA